ncbi:hypothetical protein N4T77_14675, partial [Clostridium sp. CX1]|uniref:hypothetical protein n=1 Tax=Clostridium sp. CX1 TaxID=2978346 RepID=UPI0021C1816F
LHSADGTARETEWKSRSLPGYRKRTNSKENFELVLLCYLDEATICLGFISKHATLKNFQLVTIF